MAAEAGAKLWHMSDCELGMFAPRIPSEKYGVGFRLEKQLPKSGAALYVDKFGRRFMLNEARLLSHRKDPFAVQYFGHDRAESPNIPFYMIFDGSYRVNVRWAGGASRTCTNGARITAPKWNKAGSLRAAPSGNSPRGSDWTRTPWKRPCGGQPLVIDNAVAPAASSVPISWQSAPDGYTLLLFTAANTIKPQPDPEAALRHARGLRTDRRAIILRTHRGLPITGK